MISDDWLCAMVDMPFLGRISWIDPLGADAPPSATPLASVFLEDSIWLGGDR